MSWQAWYLVIMYFLSACAIILMIGEHRKPITPGVALFSLLAHAFSVYCVLALAGVL